MSIPGKALSATAITTALLVLLAGCGGDTTAAVTNVVSNDPPSQPPVVQEIQGIATPSSVAVVTATNAQ
jgi:hypothetical protein